MSRTVRPDRRLLKQSPLRVVLVGRMEFQMLVALHSRHPAARRAHDQFRTEQEWFTTVLAGGGLKVGQVIGTTDEQGASVTDRPIQPTDLAATILTKLGIDPRAIVHTSVGRPIELVSFGEPIAELT